VPHAHEAVQQRSESFVPTSQLLVDPADIRPQGTRRSNTNTVTCPFGEHPPGDFQIVVLPTAAERLVGLLQFPDEMPPW